MKPYLEIVSSLDRIQELKSEWSRALNQFSAGTPFQSPEWLLTWWNHFGSGEIHSFAFWDGATLLGLIPCFLHNWQGARQLTLWGSGISDYMEPFIAPEVQSSVISSLQSHLDTDGSFDVCNWQDLSSDTPLANLRSGATLNVHVREDTVCSEILFPPDFDSYWMGLSSDLRRNVRRYVSKAELHGELHFDASVTVSPEVLEALFGLHAARWQKRGECGMIVANHSDRFLREISAVFAETRNLRLFSLRWTCRVVAVILGLSWNKTLYGYLSAFDPQYERFGFGRILLSEAIRYAHGTGHTAWNFLRGDEAYKQSWGAKPIPKCRIIIERR